MFSSSKNEKIFFHLQHLKCKHYPGFLFRDSFWICSFVFWWIDSGFNLSNASMKSDKHLLKVLLKHQFKGQIKSVHSDTKQRTDCKISTFELHKLITFLINDTACWRTKFLTVSPPKLSTVTIPVVESDSTSVNLRWFGHLKDSWVPPRWCFVGMSNW